MKKIILLLVSTLLFSCASTEPVDGVSDEHVSTKLTDLKESKRIYNTLPTRIGIYTPEKDGFSKYTQLTESINTRIRQALVSEFSNYDVDSNGVDYEKESIYWRDGEYILSILPGESRILVGPGANRQYDLILHIRFGSVLEEELHSFYEGFITITAKSPAFDGNKLDGSLDGAAIQLSRRLAELGWLQDT